MSWYLQGVKIIVEQTTSYTMSYLLYHCKGKCPCFSNIKRSTLITSETRDSIQNYKCSSPSIQRKNGSRLFLISQQVTKSVY